MFDAIPVSVCRLLVETLGHSLWQACLIAMACWLALRVLATRRTNLRYAISCCGLLAIVGTSLVTLSLLEPGSSTNGARHNPALVDSSSTLSVPAAPDEPFRTEETLDSETSTNSPVVERAEVTQLAAFHAGRSAGPASSGADYALHLLSLVWAAGSLLMLVRVVRSVILVRRLGAEAESGQVTSELLARIHALVAEVSRRLGL